MERTCPNCHTVTVAANVHVEVQQLACPHCRSLVTYNSKGEGKVEKKFSVPLQEPTLTVGQKGIFNGVEYTVTGVVVKQVQKHYYWREYILTAEKEDQLYLSETDGHWILLRKVDDKYDVQGYPKSYTYNDIYLKLYDYDDPKTFYAAGFFDYDVAPKHQRMIEYINPPYVFSVETIGSEHVAYFGEHISPGAVRKAFGLKNVPPRMGAGLVQPFAVDLRTMAITFCSMAVLILVSHIIIYSGRKKVDVMSQELSFADYASKDFVSAPFTLEGGSAPLEITVSSGVNNSWASVMVSLVNENTSEEVFASKDIEYYHGYEGGESWSEGSTSETFNLCGVGAGKYHLVVTPQKPAEDISNNTLKVSAQWGKPTVWNMVIPIIIMGAILLTFFYLDINFNRKRWADSSYSPY